MCMYKFGRNLVVTYPTDEHCHECVCFFFFFDKPVLDIDEKYDILISFLNK